MKYFFKLLVLLFFIGGVQSSSFAQNEGKGKVYRLSPPDIASVIESSKGQKRVLYVFASWCPSCRKTMPDMMNLERAKTGSVLAISVDEQHVDFARYLKNLKNPPFNFILNKGNQNTLAESLAVYEVKPWTSIPQMILLDEHNKLQGQGSFDADQVAEFLFSAQTQPPPSLAE